MRYLRQQKNSKGVLDVLRTSFRRLSDFLIARDPYHGGRWKFVETRRANSSVRVLRHAFSLNLDGQHLLDALQRRSASHRRYVLSGADIHDSLPGRNSVPLDTAVGRETQ